MVSDIIAVPVLVITLGFVSMYTGWKRRSIYAQMADAAPTPIGELSSPGVTEVEGTAVPVDDPLSAPLTDRDSVLAAWTVEEWDERGDKSYWREVARGIETPGFEVSDGTAAVRVEPTSERETAGTWTQTSGVSASNGVRIDDVLAEFDSFPVEAELDPDETPSNSVRRLHDDHGLYEDTDSITNVVDIGNKHGRRRYSEQIIEPGEDVYVLGQVRAREDPSRTQFYPDDAVMTAPEDGLFVLSNQDETSIEAEFESAARTKLIAGAASTVVGFGGLVYLILPL